MITCIHYPTHTQSSIIRLIIFCPRDLSSISSKNPPGPACWTLQMSPPPALVNVVLNAGAHGLNSNARFFPAVPTPCHTTIFFSWVSVRPRTTGKEESTASELKLSVGTHPWRIISNLEIEGSRFNLMAHCGSVQISWPSRMFRSLCSGVYHGWTGCSGTVTVLLDLPCENRSRSIPNAKS